MFLLLTSTFEALSRHMWQVAKIWAFSAYRESYWTVLV